MNGDHLQKRVTGGQVLTHDGFEEGLVFEITLARLELDADFLKYTGDGFLVFHYGIVHLEDRVENEHVESTLEGLAICVLPDIGPLAGGRIEVVITPEPTHQPILVRTKLPGILGGELSKCEAPSLDTSSESDGSLVRVNLDITQGTILIGGDHDVHLLYGALKGLVEGFLAELEFKKTAIDFVDDDNRLDALGKGLTEHGFGLYANTLYEIDDDEGAVGNTESSSDF